jgi:hypothetical protein
MSPEPQDAFDDWMKLEVYSSYLNPSMSPVPYRRGLD